MKFCSAACTSCSWTLPLLSKNTYSWTYLVLLGILVLRIELLIRKLLGEVSVVVALELLWACFNCLCLLLVSSSSEISYKLRLGEISVIKMLVLVIFSRLRVFDLVNKCLMNSSHIICRYLFCSNFFGEDALFNEIFVGMITFRLMCCRVCR